MTATQATAKHPGGRPRILRPCGMCGKKFSAREMQQHVPQCQGKLAKGAGQ